MTVSATARISDASATPTPSGSAEESTPIDARTSPGPATASPEPATTGTPTPEILPPVGTSAATNLEGQAKCSNEQPPKPIAQLRWTPASPTGTAQRVDVTIFSFDGTKFDSSDVLPGDQTSLLWPRVSGSAIHFWRVLTRQPEGWVSTDIASFTGVTCGPF